MTTTTNKIIVVQMSERSPVKIDPALWPQIASAQSHDGEVRCQANTEYYIRVRQHADGRRLVYGAKVAGGGGYDARFQELRGGYLLAAGADEQETIRAIRRIAGIIGSSMLAAECIGDLPAEELI